MLCGLSVAVVMESYGAFLLRVWMEALKLLRKSRKLCRKKKKKEKDVFIRILHSRCTGALKIDGSNPIGFQL